MVKALDQQSQNLPHHLLGLTRLSRDLPSATMSLRVFGVAFCLVLGGMIASRNLGAANAPEGVNIREQDGRLRVEINGALFTEYHYRDVSRPFLYPVLGPGDLPMTRNWPMKEAPGEERDHPHQRSLWWTHGDINGVDFWSEAANAGKTIREAARQCTEHAP